MTKPTLLALGASVLLSIAGMGCSSAQAQPAKRPAATAPSATAQKVAPLPVGTKARCPVSGEEFTVTASTAQAVYNGKSYAFCCPDCKPSFVKHPEKYVKSGHATAGCPVRTANAAH